MKIFRILRKSFLKLRYHLLAFLFSFFFLLFFYILFSSIPDGYLINSYDYIFYAVGLIVFFLSGTYFLFFILFHFFFDRTI